MDRTLLKMMDFRRSRGTPLESAQHPLVAASMALSEPASNSRTRTGNLVGLLLTHATRSRRKAQPKASVRLQVLTPAGANAVRVRV